MGEIVKADYDHCHKCIYHMKFGAMASATQTNKNIACNYREIEGHSRIFDENGNRRDVPTGYCDQFREGKSITKEKGWTSDAMTLRSQRKVKAGLNL